MIQRSLLGLGLLMAITMPLVSQQPDHSLLLAVRPAAEIRLGGYGRDLFGVGAGGSISASYAMPFFTPLSFGGDVDYSYVPVLANVVSEAFSFSMISATFLIDFRWVFFGFLEAGLHTGGGYFYAFLNEADPVTGDGFVGFYGVTAGYLFNDSFSIELVYRESHAIGLDSHMAIGVGATLRL